jgi:hypothetical protein
MTVNRVDGDQATCLWSTEEGNVLTGSFAIAVLTAPITTPAADPREPLPRPLRPRSFRALNRHWTGGSQQAKMKAACRGLSADG